MKRPRSGNAANVIAMAPMAHPTAKNENFMNLSNQMLPDSRLHFPVFQQRVEKSFDKFITTSEWYYWYLLVRLTHGQGHQIAQKGRDFRVPGKKREGKNKNKKQKWGGAGI